MLDLIIGLASGALGGNGAAKAAPSLNLGTLWNSVAGIAGGGLGSQLLGMVVPSLGAAAAGGGMDIGSILAQVAGGGVGGGVLMAIIGIIKKAMAK